MLITDNGHGIPAEMQDHIFEPFFTTKEQGKGTGLGLAMVFGIIKRSQGLIAIDPEVEQDTTFNLYLPQAQQNNPIVEEENNKLTDKLLQGSETILIVDNESGLLELAEQATAQYPELKVLLTSGYTEKIELTIRQTRFNDNRLNKPYTIVELVNRERTLLD